LIRLDGLVSVVDAENFPRALQEHGELARAQVSAADLIVLAKIDLSGEARAAEVEGKIRAIAPRARIIRASHGEVPLSALLGLDPDPAKLDAVEEHEHEHDHDHDHDHHHEGDPTHGFTTWTFRETRPLHWRTLAPVLAELPAAVFRAKGILSLAERPGDRLSLHVVGGRVHVRTIEPWNDRPPRSEVVFIGSAGVFDPTVLEPRLRASTEG
jgi:G3E family GTPase